MNQPLISEVLKSGGDKAIQALLDDTETVFWVDWREEEEAIVRYCETILQTGTLAADLADVDTADGCELYIDYNGRRVKVPLTFSPQDRHIAICTLNEILAPDYEVRFFTASRGMDTLAFVPLPVAVWKQLEAQYPSTIGKHFYRILPKPNLFTDELPF